MSGTGKTSNQFTASEYEQTFAATQDRQVPLCHYCTTDRTINAYIVSFNIFLTVHLRLILVDNQLNAQFTNKIQHDATV